MNNRLNINVTTQLFDINIIPNMENDNIHIYLRDHISGYYYSGTLDIHNICMILFRCLWNNNGIFSDIRVGKYVKRLTITDNTSRNHSIDFVKII
jgi:hypothetical protein